VTLLTEAAISVKDGQTQTVTHIFIVPDGKGRGKVEAQLLQKNQSVHYWLERK
jgi:hypothetical protein